MDLFLSRQEIRRQILATTGYTTDGVLGSQDTQRVNALIDQASLMVAAQCRWISARRVVQVGLEPNTQDISYRFLEQAHWMAGKYPTLYNPLTYGTPADTWVPTDLATAPIGNVGPGGVYEIAYWDPEVREYTKIPRLTHPVAVSQDRLLKYPAEVEKQSVYAGDDSATTAEKVSQAVAEADARRTRPYSYEARTSGIRLWPLLDTRYVLNVSYDVTPTWQYAFASLGAEAIDQQLSIVDGLAIVFYVCAEMYAQQGDDYQAKRYEGRAVQRIMDLRGRQNTGESIPLDSEATFDLEHANSDRYLPRWDLGPIIR